MSTLQQLRHGLDHAWQSISDGWHQFSERASQALTRFNPIHHTDEEDNLPRQIENNASRWGLLAAEMHEDDDNVYVKLEAPGMEANDFDIQVIENVLVVRGEKQVQKEKTEGRYHLMECAYGSFERAMALPSPVDQNSAGASYKRGILSITLPKTSHKQSSRITVNG